MDNNNFNSKFYSTILLLAGISGLVLTLSFFYGYYGVPNSQRINFSSPMLIIYFLFNSLIFIISSILLKNRNKIGIVLMVVGTLSILLSIFFKAPNSFVWYIKDNLFLSIISISFFYGLSPLVGIFMKNPSNLLGVILSVFSMILTITFFLGIIINLIKIKFWKKHLDQNK